MDEGDQANWIIAHEVGVGTLETIDLCGSQAVFKVALRLNKPRYITLMTVLSG
jgi:hypothetical protein